MAILINPETKVICQGMTGRTATFHCARMQSYETQLVGGVTPGKGGQRHLDLPIYDTVAEAVEQTGADATLVFVPPSNAGAAIIEAIESDIGVIVCVTERVPVLDMVRVRQALEGSSSVLIGPNSQGLLAPGIGQLGVMSTVDARRGRIGIASRSASLTSEIVAQTTQAGLGQSTTVGVGGDPVHGMSLADCVERFIDDDETEGIVIVGEIGGTEEEHVAALLDRRKTDKPVVALVVGRHAPPERRMGHAGALVSGLAGSASAKIDRLRSAGVIIAPHAGSIGDTMRSALN